jgi:hypothetical protein
VKPKPKPKRWTHPLTARHALGGADAERACSELRAILEAHGGDVRATAAALDPPVGEQRVHFWLTRWGVARPARAKVVTLDGIKATVALHMARLGVSRQRVHQRLAKKRRG